MSSCLKNILKDTTPENCTKICNKRRRECENQQSYTPYDCFVWCSSINRDLKTQETDVERMKDFTKCVKAVKPTQCVDDLFTFCDLDDQSKVWYDNFCKGQGEWPEDIDGKLSVINHSSSNYKSWLFLLGVAFLILVGVLIGSII